jgi:hypothetical protein
MPCPLPADRNRPSWLSADRPNTHSARQALRLRPQRLLPSADPGVFSYDYAETRIRQFRRLAEFLESDSGERPKNGAIRDAAHRPAKLRLQVESAHLLRHASVAP